jgi:prevent-host-death family protein
MDMPVTNQIPAAEAKARLSELLARAENGETITILRHGKPVARITPMERATTDADRKAYMRDWLRIRREANITLGDDLDIKTLVAEGRR